MKCSKSFGVTVAALIIAALFLWSRIDETNNSLMILGSDGAREYILEQNRAARAATNYPPSSSNRPPHDLGFRQKANDLSNGQKVESTTNSLLTKP